MAKRRRRSSGGKDGNGHYQSTKKRGVFRDVLEKVPVPSEGCSCSSNVTKRDASSQELSSVMQQIKISAPDSRPKNESKGTSVVSRATQKSNRGRSLRKLNKGKSHARENSISQNPPAAAVADEEDDEVVHNSQEAVDPPAKPADEKLLKEPHEILALYKRLTGIVRKPPEKVEDPLRNEYRELFCVGTICENLSNVMAARLASAAQLRKQRLESLTQLKALTLRLEEMNNANLTMEK